MFVEIHGLVSVIRGMPLRGRCCSVGWLRGLELTDGLLERSNTVDQADGLRLGGDEEPAVRLLADFVDRHASAAGDGLEEWHEEIVDLLLQPSDLLLRDLRSQQTSALDIIRRQHMHFDAGLLKQCRPVLNGGQHSDRTHERRGVIDIELGGLAGDRIRRRRNKVLSPCEDGLDLRRRRHGVREISRARHGAARGVDAEQDPGDGAVVRRFAHSSLRASHRSSAKEPRKEALTLGQYPRDVDDGDLPCRTESGVVVALDRR